MITLKIKAKYRYIYSFFTNVYKTILTMKMRCTNEYHAYTISARYKTIEETHIKLRLDSFENIQLFFSWTNHDISI